MKHSFYYCERDSFNYAAEPLNFITNFSFILVSILLFFNKNIFNKRYALLIFLIGLGSMLFHSIQNNLTGFLDVFFIVLFIIYFLINLYKKLGIKSYFAYTYSIIFIFICYFFGKYFNHTFLGDSAFYFPILLHLYILLIYFIFKNNEYHLYKKFIWIPLLFTISLTTRSIDLKFCDIIPLGTHYIWHILNSIVLYLLVIIIHLIAYRSSPEKPPQT